MIDPIEAFVQSSPDGIIFIRLDDGRIVFVNEAFQNLMGYLPEELLGRRLSILMPPVRAKEQLAALEAAGIRGRYEFIGLHKNGREISLECSCTRFSTRSGPFLALTICGNRERMADEDLVHSSEIRYRTIFESTQDAVFLMREDRFVDCNEATLRVFGCRRDQIIGKSPERFSPALQPDNQESLRKARQKIDAALSGTPQRFEWRHSRLDGTEFDAEVSLDRFQENGQPMLLAVVRNVTKRKKAERKLMDAETKYRSLVENTSDWVWEVDEEGRYTYCSPKVKELLGYDPQDVLGRTPFGFTAPEDVARVRDAFRNCVRNQTRIVGLKNAAIRKDGTKVVLETSGEPVIEGGRLLGYRGIDRDITEREKAEEVLRAANEQIYSILESIDDGFFSLDHDLSVTYFNSAAERFLKRKSGEVLGKPLFDSFPEIRGSVFEQQYRRVIEEKCPVSFETYFGIPPYQGWYEFRVYPKDNGISVFFKVITERKHAEEALRTREEQLLMLVKHTPAAIAMLDTEMRYLAVSDRFLTDYRLGNRNLTGLSHYDIFPEIRNMKDWMEIHRRCLAGATERREEDPFLRSDGSLDWIKWEIVPWRKTEGGIGGIVMFTEVITERKRAQETLRQKKEELDKFFSVTLDLLCIADMAGRFQRLNAAWQRTLGYSCEELVSGRIPDFVHPDDLHETLEAMSALASGREVVNFVNRFRRKDGVYRWLEWRSTPHGELIYSAARDITDRKEAEEQLKSLNVTLERRISERTSQLRVLAERLTQTEHRERRQFAHVLHEHFQQLLVGAKMRLEALKNSVKDEGLTHHLDSVDQILTESIDLSRSLAVELSPPILHTLGLVPTLYWLARKTQEKYDLRVEVYADPRSEPDNDEVKTLLFEIVSELLFNVLKHANVKEASIRMTLTAEGQTELIVSDSGVGFDPEKLKSQSTERFGLFNIRERVDWMAGTMQINSIPGRGTNIVIRLPV